VADTYFKNFPKIAYANSLAINITDRVRVLDSVIGNPYVFYPFDLSNGIRADQVADSYYNDQFRSWIIYLSNKIIDPYYQWYLQPQDFNDYLTLKYDLPVSQLQQLVAFYRNNWYETDEALSVQAYDDLDFAVHKFWQPNYEGSDRVINYTRVQADWKLTTNIVVSYDVSSNTLFSNNEIVSISYLDGNNAVGSGQVAASNSTVLVVQHVSGTPYDPGAVNGSSYVYGTTSGANVHFSNTVLLANNIPAIEDPYWSPVTIYDAENEINEQNKTINILDSRFAAEAVTELKSLLKG
jgi:hypothetical protein